MSREILFRGKTEQGEWVFGSLIMHSGYAFITGGNQVLKTPSKKYNAHTFEGLYEVNPSTIGQYTNAYDRKGKQIYEGDILSLWWDGIHADGTPINTTYILKDICMFLNDTCGADIEVIGNIHESEVGE